MRGNVDAGSGAVGIAAARVGGPVTFVRFRGGRWIDVDWVGIHGLR